MKQCYVAVAGLIISAALSCHEAPAKKDGRSGQRIVSISKQLTEILFAVGGDSALVGADISSTYPEAAKKLPKVGYHRALNAEGIIALHPTMVWHDGNIAPEHVIEQLKRTGVPMRRLSAGESIDSTKWLIRQIASEFHHEKRGDSLCDQLEADMRKVEEKRKKYTTQPKVLIIHFGQAANHYFVLNRRGTPQKMLEWAGASNAADTAQRWKDLSAEVIAQAQPDVILATDFGYDLQGSLEKFKLLPGIALSPAAHNNRIYRIEEHDLVYMGPRTGQNVLRLMELVHGK